MALIKSFIFMLSLPVTFYSCTDKNLEDYNREQLQNEISRISAVSGSYSGEAISQVDGQKLGSFSLEFRAKTDVQNSSSSPTNQQRVAVSGTISLIGLISSKVSFDNGFYNDETGEFQATIPVLDNQEKEASLYLKGSIVGDSWQGTIELQNQADYGAKLFLSKNLSIDKLGKGDSSAIRIQDVKNLNLKYSGVMKVKNTDVPVKLSFVLNDKLPAQKFYGFFSPYTLVETNLNFGPFYLNFKNAFIDDYQKTLSAHDPDGVTSPASLNCSRYKNSDLDFGWDCRFETSSGVFLTHLKAEI